MRARTLALVTALSVSVSVSTLGAGPAAGQSSISNPPAVEPHLQQLATQLPDNPVLMPAPVQHPGAPTPSAFTPEQMLTIYQSDNSLNPPFYFDAVDQFPHLPQHVLDESLRTVIQVNNASASNPAVVERALADAHDDLMITMADAWGPTLAGHFRDAVKENRVPKTTQLLGGTLARGGLITSSTFAEKYYYGYDRPFVVAPDQIVRNDRPGENAYETTPAFPSGHTNQATWKSILMATMMPELGVQMLARGSEVGYNRMVLGVHYPLDVIGGRQTGHAAAIDRLRDPTFSHLLNQATQELRAELEWRCGTSIADCAAKDAPYLSDAEAVRIYTERMTYGFAPIGQTDRPMSVPPYAEVLLHARFPELDWPQRQAVLHLTAIESGYPLDRAHNSYNRLNLAAAWVAEPRVMPDGGIVLE